MTSKRITDLVGQLKDNNEDHEFYPSSQDMVDCIRHSVGTRNNIGSLLDIGAGDGNFQKKYNKEYNKTKDREIGKICDYYAIEKSRILIENMDKDTIILGTDFNGTTLIDKKVDTIFCNPPYSEYKEWTKKIIKEGNCKDIYLIIPQRWKDQKDIMVLLENGGISYKVIGEFDFLDSERQARAKVDIVKITKNYRQDPFGAWFDENFKIKEDKRDDWEIKREKAKEIKEEIALNKSVSDVLVDRYNQELSELQRHFKAIVSLDISTLKTIGVEKDNVSKALKSKIEGLKTFYWKQLFENLDKITNRLTTCSRENLINKFERNQCVEFNHDNIYAVVLWVMKNASSYYDEQLVSIYKKLADVDNVKAYKSNQKVFSKEKWRWTDENTHYTLEYRIVTNNFPLQCSWGGDIGEERVEALINNFRVIANNLGFYTDKPYAGTETGVKQHVYFKDSEKIFLEWKLFKNRNVHLKFDLEFMKAFNVEASRLLGWIKNKEDVEKEFCEEMKGASKYFKTSFTLLDKNVGNFLAIGK